LKPVPDNIGPMRRHCFNVKRNEMMFLTKSLSVLENSCP